MLVGGYHAFPEQARLGFVGLGHGLAGVAVNRVPVAGYDIEYYDSGTDTGDSEPLVLIHGFGGDKENFTAVAPFLTGSYRVIAPDLLGFGESSKPLGERYQIEDQVQRLHDFVKSLGLKRVHLGGNSMGGWIAGAYAARYPDEVASLWLLGTAMVAGAEPSEMQRRIKAGEPLPLLVKTEADFEPLMDFVMSRRRPLPSAIKDYVARRAVQDYALHKRIFEGPGSEPPLEYYVKELATPTLIVWGDQDRVLHYSGAKVLDELMPNAEVIILPGIGHLPMLEDPWRTSRDYLAWRARLNPGKAS
ncbi:MAG: alpha/beta fold hydrolase [Nevskiales bacterium]